MSETSDSTNEQFLAFDVAEQLLARIRNGDSVDLQQEYARLPQIAAVVRRIVELALETEGTNATGQRSVSTGTTANAPSFADTKAEHSTVPAAVEQTIRYAPGQVAAMFDNDGVNTSTDVPLNYLSPSKKPGSLGRLGHYEILEVLGKGAFGTVLRAFDEKLHRMVAIKLMSSELALTSPARKRFLREARASAAIRHDNVVAIHAVEEQPIPYLVMEYVPGITLQQALDRNGPLDLADALRLGQQIASGLAAAHAQGLIHRDIKPANILLEEGLQWKVKITDFGLARAADDASNTQSGIIAGTPMYMSPEQAHGSNVDLRSDLFSFGSVLYQMICGRPPFRATSTLAVLKRVTEDTPRPIQEVLPEVPDWMVSIISRLHQKNAGDRYQTAQEVAELLARCQFELQNAGHVTCVAESASARRNPEWPGEPDSFGRDKHIARGRPVARSPLADQKTSVNGAEPEASGRIVTSPVATHSSFRRSNSVTWKNWLALAMLPAVAVAIIFAVKRDLFSSHIAGNGSELANTKSSEVSNENQLGVSDHLLTEDMGWLNWPATAPKPAIAPFPAEQAKQHQEEWARYLNIPVEFTNSIGMKFLLIPPGEFQMGIEEEEAQSLSAMLPEEWWRQKVRSAMPKRTVIITKPYYIGAFEVTQAEYFSITGHQPSDFSKEGGSRDKVANVDTSRFPAEMVSFADGTEFCNRLAMADGLPIRYQTDNGFTRIVNAGAYRLPSEAQWEFACRAGTESAWHSGDQDSDLNTVAWTGGVSGDMPHPVGRLLPNAFGLFDMHGNLWEFCEDWYDSLNGYGSPDGGPAIDPSGAKLSTVRVIRGGCWFNPPYQCRSALRSAADPSHAVNSFGIRIVVTAEAVRESLKLSGPEFPVSPATPRSNSVSGAEADAKE